MRYWWASEISSSPRAQGAIDLDRFEDMVVVQVDARHRVVALGMLRLLLDADDAAIPDFGDAEPLGIRNA